MNPQLLSAPAELTLPAAAGFLEQLLAAPGPLQVDLAATTEIDLAGLQLLIAAAQDQRITFAPSFSPPLDAACRAAGINPAIFTPGDHNV